MGTKLKRFIITKWHFLLICLGLLASLRIALTAIRVGVDPYHEGALLPSAVGFAQGLMIFKDVNNQYGFMYALLQSPFYYFFGNYLLVGRIVGFLVFIFNAFLLYKIIRLKIDPKAALFTSLLICSINPSWSYLSTSTLGGYSIWINQYGITFTLLSVLILFKNFEKSDESNLLIFISSFVGFCASYVRLEFAAVWVVQLIFLSMICRERKIHPKGTGFWVAGGLFSLILGISLLAIRGGLSDAIAQLVTVWFSAPPNNAHLGLGNILTLIVSFFSFVYLVVTVRFVLRFKYWFIYAPITILGNLIFARLLLDYLPDFQILGKMVGPYLFTSFEGLLLNYSSVLFLLILWLIISEIQARTLGLNFESGFLLATSLGLMAQLHNVNSAYIFMLNPIFLACILIYFHQERHWVLKANFNKSLVITISILIFASLVNGLFLVSKTNYGYRAEILKGMFSENMQIRDEIDGKFLLLKSTVSGRNLFMDCPYGLYSVSEQGLITAEKWTWNEIPEKWRLASLSEVQSGQYLLHCGGDDKQALQYSRWESLGVIESVGHLQNFHLYKVLKDNFLEA